VENRGKLKGTSSGIPWKKRAKPNGIERKMVQGGVGVGVGLGVCVAVAGVAAWRGVAWRGTLIRTDTTLDHSQKAGKKQSWDIPGKGDTLRGMAWRGMALPLALALALAVLRPRPQPRCRRWRWRWHWHWRWRCVSLGLGLGPGRRRWQWHWRCVARGGVAWRGGVAGHTDKNRYYT
jgi:hypothetical protein